MSEKTGGRVTIEDVAKKAGVSIATVSRTLNNIGVVKENTRRKVIKAVNALGYSPNVHATSLARGHSNILGLVVPDITNPLFNELAKALGEEARAHGLQVILTNSYFDPDTAYDCIQGLVKAQVAGIILFTSVLDLNVIERIADQAIPVCVLDLNLTRDYVSNVSIEFRNSTLQVLEHLIALNHRRIAYVNVRGPLKVTPERTETFQKCCDLYESFLDRTWILRGDYSMAGGETTIKSLFDRDETPTAIWFTADVMAVGAIRELNRRGLQSPLDVSVVGWGNTIFAQWSEPELTTVFFDYKEVGELAVTAIRHLLEARIKTGLRYTVNSRLIVRSSTGPARTS